MGRTNSNKAQRAWPWLTAAVLLLCVLVPTVSVLHHSAPRSTHTTAPVSTPVSTPVTPAPHRSVPPHGSPRDHTGPGSVTAAPVLGSQVAAPRTYTVKAGDCLYNIARHHDWKPLARHNNIRAPYIIHPGQVLVL